MHQIPLAWLQLKREKLRLLVAIAGVAFAVILIFMQLGFNNALFDSAVRIHGFLDADLVIISPQFDYLAAPKNFTRRRLYQALGAPGVESVGSLYAGLRVWKNPVNAATRAIFVIGFDPSEPALNLPDVASQLDKIRLPDVVLFDELSRPEFGPIASEVRAGREFHAEVAGRRIGVGGLFGLGTSFGIDGTLITSDLNFQRIPPGRDPGLIEIGLIRVARDADPEQVQRYLASRLPADVLVLTKRKFIEREKRYWATSTPIGFVFALGVVIGLVVGAIIVYQILFSDVTDHLAEYATLKAMGYPNSYLFSVVLQEAVLLAILGYIPGLLICMGLYHITENATRLPMTLTLRLGGLVAVLTVVMCAISGIIALRKVRSADPAEIF
jgi:putative ABC transport system permease protein